jgi:predicted regulator of Ras-like GTPase activity (Roadblock/LC7/MglB family)
MVSSTHLRYTIIADILHQMNQQGGFSITVLTDENGFPIASSDEMDESSEVQAAVVAQIQKVIVKVQNHLDMAEPEELSLNDVNGRKLVCRSFQAGESRVILAVLIPSRDKTYRRLMNQAVRSVQKTWE